MRAIQCGNPNCNVPNYGSLKMSNIDMCVMHFVVTGFFGDPKFGTLHLGLLPCIAVTDYSWLIVVINCNNEVCSHSNNMSRGHSGKRKFFSDNDTSRWEWFALLDAFLQRLLNRTAHTKRFEAMCIHVYERYTKTFKKLVNLE